MTDDPTSNPQRLDVDWLRAAAGALAAMASAVLLSTLGAAGTLIGAALGSVVVTVGSAVFAQGLSTSKRTLEKAQASALQKVGIAQAEVRRASRADDTLAHDSHLRHADERLAQAQDELDAVNAGLGGAAPDHGADTPAWRERLARLPWKRIGLTAAALFVVTVAVITAFELAAGRSVASYTGGAAKDGGTTIGHVGGAGSGSSEEDPGGSRPTDSTGPDDASEPTDPSPSDGSSPSQDAEESVTPSPTDEPTPTAPTIPAGTPTPALTPQGSS